MELSRACALSTFTHPTQTSYNEPSGKSSHRSNSNTHWIPRAACTSYARKQARIGATAQAALGLDGTADKVQGAEPHAPQARGQRPAGA